MFLLLSTLAALTSAQTSTEIMAIGDDNVLVGEVGLVLAAGASGGLAPAYTVVDLGANVLPVGVTRSGVVGCTLTHSLGVFEPYVRADGQLTPLGQLPETDAYTTLHTQALGIGDDGILVGSADIIIRASEVQFQLGWEYHNGAFQPLPTAPVSGDPLNRPLGSTLALGHSRAGAVGYGDALEGQTFTLVALRLTPAGAVELPSLEGDPHASCAAIAINAIGQIVGDCDVSDGSTRAVKWTVLGTPLDLGIDGVGVSEPLAVNRVGQACGLADLRGASWDAFGRATILPDLPGGFTFTACEALNNQGVLVGGTIKPDNDPKKEQHKGIAWVDGQVIDLNTVISAPGWVVQDATGVNDAGQIAALCTLDGAPHGCLLQPSTADLARR